MATILEAARSMVSAFGGMLASLGTDEKASTVRDYYPLPDALIFDDSIVSNRLEHSGAFRLYRQSSAVATAVDMIAEKVEALIPVIEDRDGNKAEGIGDDILDLLMMPNGYQTYREWIGEITRHFLLTGNYYIFAGGSKSRLPFFMFPTHPAHVHANVSAVDNFADSFTVSAGMSGSIGDFRRVAMPDGMIRYFDTPLREIYQGRGFSSRSHKVAGDSPLEPVMMEVRQLVQGALHNANMLAKGARPSAVFAFKESMNEVQYKSRVEEINKKFAGSNNTGRIAVLSAKDLEIIMLGHTNVEMDFVELTKQATERVFSKYSIPAPLVSQDRQTFNNYGTAVLAFYDDAVCPTADIIFGGLSRLLLPRAGLDLRRYKITYDQMQIDALRMRILEELEKRKEMGLETPNELRELMPDRGPVEGGDKVYQPATLVPLGTDPLAMQEDEENDDPDDEAARIAGPGDDN